MEKKYKKGKLAKQILTGLAVGGLAVATIAMPGLAQIFTLFKIENGKDRKRIWQTAKNLQNKKYIRIYAKNGEEVVELTDKGKKKILQYKIEEIAIKKPKKWDGLWRIVIFDIPEKRRGARGAINFKLKEIGMFPIQKSTFISPYECGDEIDFIGQYFFVRNHIIYMVAKEIDNELKIKKYFGL
ncbi:MAG: hypothetical protein AAB488_01970 [Patescibacteria group bacterium]